MVTDPARLTVLVPWIADRHEELGPTCLLAPDGEQACGMAATHRAELAALPGYESGPVTFVCDQHTPTLRARPDLHAIRKVHPHVT